MGAISSGQSHNSYFPSVLFLSYGNGRLGQERRHKRGWWAGGNEEEEGRKELFSFRSAENP